MLAELDRNEKPYPIGWKEFPIAVLPARDGLPHGNVVRSAKAPNCSYFTGWKSTEDRITWDVEAPAEGVYEVRIDYACPASDVGSTIELASGEARLEATLAEPNDPPLLGAEHDRVDRGTESYVKAWRSWNFGTIRLPAGPQRLSLRALRVPGKSVMEVRSVVLERKP